MMTVREIRELLGVSRAEFSRRYNIPIRTLENWESGTREAPEWTMEILERVVREDAMENNGVHIVYYVWKYVTELRRRYGEDICTDPEIVGDTIGYIVQPDDPVEGTIYEYSLDDGSVRHKGIGRDCVWTDWEECNIEDIIELGLE